MKKLVAFLLTLMVMTATAGAIDIYVDTNPVETDTEPIVVDGRTMVPLRAIFEALGATVEWEQSSRTATGVRDDVTVSIQIDSTTAYVNGIPRTLDVPAQLINGRTMVPARFVSESMGCDVSWDQATQTVGIADKLRGQRIYVTATGERYHFSATCNGGTYYEATLAEAMGRGLTPCDKCVLTSGAMGTNTDGSSDIPGWLLNNTPSDSSPGQSGPSSGNDIPDWLLNDTSASDTDPDYSYQEPFNPTGETTGQSNRETVYWVESGEKYHSSPDCVSLKRSKRILQGTLGEAIRTGHDEPCNLCC